MSIASQSAHAQVQRLFPQVVTQAWREATISVRAFEPFEQFFIDIGGYEELARGEISRGQLDHWRLPAEATGQYRLLRAPGSDGGYIRLVRFVGVPQISMRLGAQPWDTGGFYSINFRAKGTDEIFAKAAALGFHAMSEPVRMTSPSSTLKSVFLIAPDGTHLGLYERTNPPLENFPDFQLLSPAFSATQSARNATITSDFFLSELGLKRLWQGDVLDPIAQPNAFGLPHNLAVSIPRRTQLLWARPGPLGRLEITEFVGLEGRDLSLRVTPPNFGIISVAFEVASAETAARSFGDAAGLAKYPLRTFELAPYGTVSMFTAQAPDGALIDVYEVVEPSEETAAKALGKMEPAAGPKARPLVAPLPY